MLAALSAAACGGQRAAPGPSHPSEPPILNTTTVAALVTAFRNAGLPVPNARDVTQDRCPPIDCTAATDSDTVEIIKFGNTGAAQRFAGVTRDVYQIEDIALVFAQNVSADQRRDYERVVRQGVGT
ncbi:MAG TPA: hypothetical protein VH496_14115 [Mycobacterium sp.]